MAHGRSLPKSRAHPIQWPGCQFKDHYSFCSRSGLYWSNSRIMGLLGQGNDNIIPSFLYFLKDQTGVRSFLHYLSTLFCLFKLQVKKIVQPGCPEEVLKAALSSMGSVIDVLSIMSTSTFRGTIPSQQLYWSLYYSNNQIKGQNFLNTVNNW